MFYTVQHGERRHLSRDHGEERAHARSGHALRVEPQSLHRLRAGLRLLLRARVPRAPRTRHRCRLRSRDRREGQLPGPSRARAASAQEARNGRPRHGHRSLPAVRRPLPHHATNAGGARRITAAARRDHQRLHGGAGHRSARSPRREGLHEHRHGLDGARAHLRAARLATEGSPRSGPAPGSGRHRRGRARRADPPRAQRQ